MSKKRLPKISELSQCPYCGNDDNFYYSAPAKGIMTTVFRFSDKQYDPTSNEMMYERVVEGKASKNIYCNHCSKIIARNDMF